MSDCETADRSAIEADQIDRLRALIDRLIPNNPFWSRRLAAAGIDARCPDLNTFRNLPLLEKQELVEDHQAHPPFGSNLTDPLESYCRIHHTSGTTAAPLHWPDTSESWQWMLESWKKVFAAAEVGPTDSLFFAFSFGPFLGFWTAFEAATQIGALCLSGGGMGTVQRLAAMRQARSTVLCCTPTYAIHLSQTARTEKIRPEDLALRRVVVAGEPGGSVEAVRRVIGEGLGAEVFDHHGMTEVGPVTYQCPGRPGTLRVIETSYLAEVVDPKTALAVKTGQEGELVLTTLGRSACPLLRYRTGDRVRPVYRNDSGDGPGPHLCLEGGILGRADDMVIVRGVNVYPAAVDQVVRETGGVSEYRVLVGRRGAMAELKIEFEPKPEADGPQVARRLTAALQRALSLRIPVEPVRPDSLPRFEMKARRWVQVTS